MNNSENVWDCSSEVDARVERLLAQLTLEQKIDLVTSSHNSGEGTKPLTNPSPEIPPSRWADGPAGVRRSTLFEITGTATALPAPIALAATWSPALAHRYGDLMGQETAATGHHVLLGPAVDIARAPRAGRTFESFGEDPLLQARLVVPEILGLQANHVQACLKHYVVNNQETARSFIDVQVEERALQEIYLPPYAAAVRQGHLASVMGSYNKINGTYACENYYLLTTVLREQFGFRGWVVTDFMAKHETVRSANAGLDRELDPDVWGKSLLDAVQSGGVSVATIDEMVRRQLRPVVGLGQLEHPPAVAPFDVHAHGAVAREIAEQAIVLLKNENALLPLDAKALASIAVIGPDADNISAAGGGSAHVVPTYSVSVLDGIRQRVGKPVRVEYAPGVDPISVGVLLPGPPAIPSAFLTHEQDGARMSGLFAEYWANPKFEGEPSHTRMDSQIELNQTLFDSPGLGVSSPKFMRLPQALGPKISARWNGTLEIPDGGEYVLSLTTLGSARLFVDGQLEIDATRAPAVGGAGSPVQPAGLNILWTGGGAQVLTKTFHFAANSAHAFSVEYAADVPEQDIAYGAQVRLGWIPPGQTQMPFIEHAVELARRCDAAVVVVRTYETEGMDRPNLELPHDQDRLIRAVAAANPRTVVVLMSGSAVDVTAWVQGPQAILEAWYAGQEQGSAIARVLFGDVNPSGKLPLTFPRCETETPVSTPAQFPGVDNAVHYSEGIFIGYRGYEKFGIVPQYPFGFGLSYTTFSYANLRTNRDSFRSGESITVQVDVTNTGARAGDEIVQMYVGYPESSVARAPQELKGFCHISLGAGETKTAEMQLAAQDLAYWDAAQHRFVVEPGAIQIRVGHSSAEILFETSAHVQ